MHRTTHVTAKDGGPPDDHAGRQHDLTPVGVRHGPRIWRCWARWSSGAQASHQLALARLSEQGRELDNLKARFW